MANRQPNLGKLEAALAKAEASGNKQQVNQLKQKIAKAGRSTDMGSGDSKPDRTLSTGRTLSSFHAPKPDSSFNGLISRPARHSGYDFTHLDIAGPSGRVYSEFPISDPNALKKPQTIVIEFNAFPGLNFSSLGSGSSEPSVVEIQNFQQGLFTRIVSEIQQKRMLSPFILSSQTDWVNVQNEICQAYITLRGLQAILEAGDLNGSVTKMVQAVEANRPALTSQLRYIRQFTLPPSLLKLMDEMVGVFQYEKDGLVLVSIFDNAFLGTTMPDLTSAADIATILTANLATLNAILGLPEAPLVCDILRLAYHAPINVDSMPVHTSRECYVYVQTCAQAEWDTTAVKEFYAPNADSVAIPITPVYHLWKKGLTAPKNLLSLLRLPVTGSAINTSHELLGFLAWLSAGGTHYAVYTEDQTLTKIISSQASVTTGITLTDLVSYFFPWAVPSSFEITPAAMSTIGSILADWDVVYSQVQQLSDETITLLEEIYIGDLNIS